MPFLPFHGLSVIDPIHSLAFSLQSNRGIYAVLLGSGVSREAKIPTGWEITLDLVRQLATLQGENADPSPEAWYLEKFGQEPDYSVLLENIAKTPAERQQLLRNYWEPTDEERVEGDKRPTAAHHAVAALAAQNYIRVIITTNFDRLIEQALRDAGVEPTVLSSPDHVQGALPLIHTKCCVLKLHGDYFDTRIRNTPTELESYPEEFEKFLDHVLDEFGLIVCGWSADWDAGLCNAIYRASSRRFTTYWTLYGEIGDNARRLIEHRNAQTIAIESASNFFQTLQQSVQSIEEFSRPHPLSTEAAIASLKRYMSESKYRIQFSDLVNEIVDRVKINVSGDAFAVQGGDSPNKETITARVRGYDAACSTLLPIASVGGYWVEEEHFDVWRLALQQLSEVNDGSGNVLWLDLQRYPTTLLLYALGLGALAKGKFEFFGYLLQTIIYREYKEDVTAVKILPPALLCRYGDHMKYLEGMEQRYAPLNDWLHTELRQHTRRLISSDDKYTLIFDKLEILVALNYAFQTYESYEDERQWVPVGAFAYRYGNKDRFLQEIQNSISEFKDESPFVRSGIFGRTVDRCSDNLRILNKFVKLLGWW